MKHGSTHVCSALTERTVSRTSNLARYLDLARLTLVQLNQIFVISNVVCLFWVAFNYCLSLIVEYH